MLSKKEFNRTIKVFEDKLDLQFSDEQLAILRYNYQSPVLLNSCAGAGKTTLLIVSILLQIIDGRQPDSILSITFSKKAQMDMESKFEQYLIKLGVTMDKRPVFRTFDAMFLHLLQAVRPVKILTKDNPVYKRMAFEMKNRIKIHSNFLDDNELVNKLFEFRSQLVSRLYTYDGYDLKNYPNTVDSYMALGEVLRHSDDISFYQNYESVMKYYVQTKNRQGFVDFTDLKTALYRMLGNSKANQTVLDLMSRFDICFIDEFQDIDNVQWLLIKKVLSKEALDHLAVIGDDDQCIYAFRGSNPKIIMNFVKNNPKTKSFTLTTNYRTAGNVLDNVSPLIQRNKYRLSKSLNVAIKNQKVGKLVCLQGYDQASGETLLLNDVVGKIKDDHVQPSDIAILCRNNVDISLAADYLADNGIYANVSNAYTLLQNNPIYNAYMEIMRGLYDNDFELIQNQATKIGFGRFRDHVATISQLNDTYQLEHIEQYLELAKLFDDKNLNLHDWRQEGLKKTDDKLRRIFTNVQSYKKKDQDHEGSFYFDLADQLIGYYYDWRLKKGYLNNSEFLNVYHRIKDKMQRVDKMDSFFNDELDRKAKMNDIIRDVAQKSVRKTNDKYVNLLTIHTSKGLEFKYVYLYNFRKNQITHTMLDLNHLFAPNITRAEFLDVLLNTPLRNLLLDYSMKGLIELARDLRARKKSLMHKKEFDKWTAVKDALTDVSVYDSQIPYQQQFARFYDLCKSYSSYVEDERRLLYVGLTRCIDSAYYNVDNQGDRLTTTPLLSELTTPNENILVMHGGELTAYDDVSEDKDYSDDDLHHTIDALNRF